MKKTVAVVWVSACLFSLPGILSAQIPNAGFENWTNGEPDGWWTQYLNMLGVASITKSTDAHSGSSALRGEVKSFYGNPVTPILFAGSAASGIPCTSRAGSLKGYYKFGPAASSEDEFEVDVILYKSNWVTDIVGAGSWSTGTSATSYTQFAVPIDYITGDSPDSAYIMISLQGSGGSDAQVGSYFLLDDLSFGPATAIEGSGTRQPAQFKLFQNYPNPFNPTTDVSFSVPSNGRALLKVFNVMGQQVATLFDRPVSAGNTYHAVFNGTGEPSGVYFSRLEFVPSGSASGAMQSINKMILTK